MFRQTVLAMLSIGLMFCNSQSAFGQNRKDAEEQQQKFTQGLQKQLNGGRRLAIVIGIDAYPTMPLKCCVRDAKLLAATLRDRCGYDPDSILELTDQQESPEHKPTLVNLRHQIRQFLGKATPKDTVLLSFSGHGGLRTEGNGDNVKRFGYICPIDFDGAREKETSLSIDELRKMLQGCLAAQKLLVLDSCHSGSAGLEAGLTITGNIDQSFQEAQGLITFAACRRDEISSEDREVGHGVFTLSFVRGIEGNADYDQNKVIDSDELYRYVLSEVPATVRGLFPGRNQTPVRVIGLDVVGVFALAPVLTRPKATAALARMKTGDVMKNSIGMPLVLLPRGSYIKGSISSEYKRHSDEEMRAVIVSKRIFMGVHEVTQAEYETVMGINPSYHSANGSGSDAIGELKTKRFPVEQVSWNDAVEFCRRLSELPDESSANRVYRLPTESEWEFACRAGSTSIFSTGEVIQADEANIRADQPYWYARKDVWRGRTQTVESYPRNAFGLCDMHGNVAEWCSDVYAERPSGLQFIRTDGSNSDPVTALEEMLEALNAPITAEFTPIQKMQIWKDATDPTGPKTGKTRVIRGGSYLSDVAQCRSAARRSQSQDYKHKAIGFRIVCEPSNVGK